MDKENLDIESLLACFNSESSPLRKESSSQKDAPQKLLAALFFMVLGLILMAIGLISLVSRLVCMMHLPLLWLMQRMQLYRANYIARIRRFKHP